MKKLILVVLLLAVASVSFAGWSNTWVTPGVGTGFKTGKITLTNNGTVGTLAANTKRLAGMVVNTSTSTIYVSSVYATTTTIYANGYILQAYGTASNLDRLWLNQDGCVFNGVLYFCDDQNGQVIGTSPVLRYYEINK